jgi:hypothetical protein
MNDIDTDHENPAVLALVTAAAAVDEQLPAAWARVADYLEAYGEDTGTPIGRRKLDGDGNIAALTIADLRVLLGALEAVLESTVGPDEDEPAGIGLADLDAKLDEILQHVRPKQIEIAFDKNALSDEAFAKLCATLKAKHPNGKGLADGGIVEGGTSSV